MTLMVTYESVDIEPGDRIARGPADDLVIFRQSEFIEHEIHLRWKNLTDYAQWCLRNLTGSLSDEDRIVLNQVLGGGGIRDSVNSR